MKKIILTVAAVFVLSFANAQKDESKSIMGFSEGDMFVEGQLGIRSGNINQSAASVKSSFVFNPRVGYMINNKVALGIDLDISGSKFYVANTNGSEKVSTFGAGAFVRYYFLSLGSDKAFQAYGQAGLGYSGSRGEFPNGNTNDSDKYNGMKGNVDVGLNYFLTKNWALTFTLTNLVSYNTFNQGGQTTNGLNMQLGSVNNPFATSQFGLLYKW